MGEATVMFLIVNQWPNYNQFVIYYKHYKITDIQCNLWNMSSLSCMGSVESVSLNNCCLYVYIVKFWVGSKICAVLVCD